MEDCEEIKEIKAIIMGETRIDNWTKGNLVIVMGGESYPFWIVVVNFDKFQALFQKQ